MNNYTMPLASCILMSIVSAPLAAEAPQKLWSKTITASYSTSVPIEGGNGIKYASSRTTRLIYVSGTGRIFERFSRVGRSGAHSADREPGVNQWRFAGGKLIATMPLTQGAITLQIGFSPDFGSCTVSGVVGHEAGKPLQWKGLDNRMYTAAGPNTVSGESCSIADGNGL